jgi:hypothetical protein
MSDNQFQDERDVKFSYGISEMRQARTKLALETKPAKPSRGDTGSDPYNTSGSFDRKKHWARLGKR